MRSNETAGKRLLNTEAAARYLGLALDTVYKKARLRDLPSVKVGRALRFDVKALDRYIEQHTFKTIDQGDSHVNSQGTRWNLEGPLERRRS
ncbi:MAG: helix-turn-helix domain-containing protein [Bryobacteraceae bacterium]|jgi:excisionase family DNA binding protein